MMWVLITDFMQNICECYYYIICLLCENYKSLHSSLLSTYILVVLRLLCVL